jgi:osomolarity two-component system sensor histidine kinase NIK1
MYVISAVLCAFFGSFSHILGTPLRQVNRMCSSLTDQVRSIATVTTAVAKGDLTRKIEIQVEGEMATLKTTVNSMVDQLSAFASEVTRVALEVGTQGILGGQARVEGVQGTWADLTLNVNVSFLSLPLAHYPS